MTGLKISYCRAVEAEACPDGIDRIEAQLGRKARKGSWVYIAKIANLNDAIWALAVVRPDLAMLFTCDCVDRALDRSNKVDERSRRAVQYARGYARGLVDDVTLRATYSSAAAAADAAYSADAAAYDADAAAYEAERQWQHARLKEYCERETSQ